MIKIFFHLFFFSVEDPEVQGGLSKDKCALAMSFFANDLPKPTKKPAPKKPVPAKTDEDGLPIVQNATARPFVKERAYYEPEQELNPDDDEDDIVPDFQARRKTRQNEAKSRQTETSNEAPPPIPVRSGPGLENNTREGMMLRLMKNATNIMRS